MNIGKERILEVYRVGEGGDRLGGEDGKGEEEEDDWIVEVY
jgi:hypothetical protein